MARTADVRLAAFFKLLIGADFVALVVNLSVGCAQQLAEFVFESFLAEVVFLFGHPFLQAEMRFDEEFRHVCPPKISNKTALYRARQRASRGSSSRGRP